MIPESAVPFLQQSGFTAGSTAIILWGMRKMLMKLKFNQEKIILPKLSNICNRVFRTEVAQGVIIDDLQDNGFEDLKVNVLDEFDRLGIPKTPPPINPA